MLTKMKIKRLSFQVILLAMIFWGLLYSLPLPQKYSLEEARKVFNLIEKVQRDQLNEGKEELMKVVVTESEFNSYIAYRIEVDQEPVMKELHFKLFNKNRLEMKIFIDLRGQKLPRILQPEMTFYLGGEIEAKEGKIRLNVKRLFLEDKQIDPKLLDMVIQLASQAIGTESSSLSDWYELPYGIRSVETQKGKAIFYY
jgi:hypothetical protein